MHELRLLRAEILRGRKANLREHGHHDTRTERVEGNEMPVMHRKENESANKSLGLSKCSQLTVSGLYLVQFLTEHFQEFTGEFFLRSQQFRHFLTYFLVAIRRIMFRHGL